MSERVARWLSSLSAKYIAVFALLVAVPVICTSVYLLYSSYQDNKRALTRLQQEKAKSVAVTIDQYFIDLTKQDEGDAGPLLVLHRTGLGASTPARRSRDRCVLRRQYRAQDARKRRAAGSPWSRGTSYTIARSSRRGRRGSTSVPCTRHGSCPTPEHDRWRSMVRRIYVTALQTRRPRGTGVVGETTRSRGHSGPRQADAARDVRIRLRGRRQRRADRAPERARFHASFLGSSSGDQGARFVEHRIDGRPQLPRSKRC